MFSGCTVGFVSQFGIIKRTEEDLLVVEAQFGDELLLGRSPKDALVTRLVALGFATVEIVLGVGSRAKVLYTIVQGVVVDVIQHLGDVPVVHKEDDPMDPVSLPLNRSDQITILVWLSNSLAFLCPSKAGLMEKLAVDVLKPLFQKFKVQLTFSFRASVQPVIYACCSSEEKT